VRRERRWASAAGKPGNGLLNDNYLGSRAACLCADSEGLLRPARSNKPTVRTANDNHQKKYPIPRPNSQPFQCALKKKATAAVHAEKCLSARVPRNITHGEPMMNSSDVSTLRIASREYPAPKLAKLGGMTALSAMTKASKPLKVGPILPPSRPVTTGRNQAEAFRNQASAIRRFGLRICIAIHNAAFARATSICKRQEWVIVDRGGYTSGPVSYVSHLGVARWNFHNRSFSVVSFSSY
jgi:hypothetical protein